jgi:Na+/melibiose symporter-like transporter
MSQNVAYFLPFSILAGFGLGGMFTVPLSMIADVIDQDELKSGERLEGIYFGSLTLFYKFSQSITLVLVGFLLDILKFDSNKAVQLPSTSVSLGLFFALGSLVAFVFALISIGYYNLNRQKIEEIQMQLRMKSKKTQIPS